MEVRIVHLTGRRCESNEALKGEVKAAEGNDDSQDVTACMEVNAVRSAPASASRESMRS